MVRGPSLPSTPTHSTIDSSSTETSVTVTRVAVTIPPRSVRSPWNTNIGLFTVRLGEFMVVSDKKSVVNPRFAPGGGVKSYLIAVPLMVQVNRTVSSEHATLVLDVKAPLKM